MEKQTQTQTGVIVSIEEHNNLMNEVKTLKQSVNNLEHQLNIKNDDIQICKITEDEMKKLISNNKLTLEKVKLFGGDLMIRNYQGNTILHSISGMGQLDILEYVLDKGVDVDLLNNFNETPLIYASIRGHIGMINLLLDKGANINHQCKWGRSALHYVCNWNQLEIVKLLVERGIDIYLKNNDNKTALDLAKLNGYQEIVDYLKSVIKERLKTDYENKLKELDRD